MAETDWFDDIPVIGKLTAAEAAEKLREIGKDAEADALLQADQQTEAVESFGIWDIFKRRVPAWKHTAHSFGYVAPWATGKDSIDIRHAGEIGADDKLKNARVKITLDGLRAAGYPGKGEHRILFDFYGQNQLKSRAEDLHFNSTYRVREGEQAAVLGYPIFVGLNVGTQGVAFKCFTVNVENTGDEALLSMMDSDLFKQGLKLVTTAQPAIAPLSGLAVALTKTMAKRHRNVPVQDFYLGLDFSNIATRARLAIGSYVAVQIPESMSVAWNWREWVFQPSNGRIVAKADPSQLIPFNYVIFSVSPFEES